MIPFEELDQKLLPDFERRTVESPDGPIRALIGGEGPPVLMLHGDPQTHLCWHAVAPKILATHTVILTDLRGRGESHKPGVTTDHSAYTKRAMAAEQLAVMNKLGFSRFSVVGHDRGARVARRMALDHPANVEKLVVMDIVPAIDFYENTDATVAQDYYYFFFLTQPHPIAENLISGAPRDFLGQILTGLPGATVPYDPEALELYLQSASRPEAITALCECFRAGRTLDIEMDTEDRNRGKKIECPTMVIWGANGVVGQCFDLKSIWSSWAPDARFERVDCGHFIPEEAPEDTARLIRSFLG